MKIETLTNLIGGELLNAPFISEVTSFTFNVDEVERGSCFFVKNKNDIKKAVEKGAYAIVSKDYENIIDKEIAWIKVDDYKKAIINIFKYENLDTKLFFTDKLTSHIIYKMKTTKNVLLLESFEDLFIALNKNVTLFTYKDEFKLLFANVIDIKEKEIDLQKISIFKSKFKNHEIKLPYVYKKEFSKAINFFEMNDLKYILDFSLERFRPIFIDYKFKQVAFGESDRVVISGLKDDEIFFRELNYIVDNTKHAKTIFINQTNKSDLYKKFFNFAVLVDIEFEVPKKEEIGSLF